MATLALNIPNGDAVTTVLPVMVNNLAQRGIPTDTLTQVQIAQRYLAEHIKDIYREEKRKAAQTAVQPTINTALATAETTASGIA